MKLPHVRNMYKKRFYNFQYLDKKLKNVKILTKHLFFQYFSDKESLGNDELERGIFG